MQYKVNLQQIALLHPSAIIQSLALSADNKAFTCRHQMLKELDDYSLFKLLQVSDDEQAMLTVAAIIIDVERLHLSQTLLEETCSEMQQLVFKEMLLRNGKVVIDTPLIKQ